MVNIGEIMAELSRLPGPVADLWEWQYQGACREVSTEQFFHPQGERGSSRRNRAAQAKAICSTCPVIAQCRRHALAVREPYGVWGGLTEEERDAVYQRSKKTAAQTTPTVSPLTNPAASTRRSLAGIA